MVYPTLLVYFSNPERVTDMLRSLTAMSSVKGSHIIGLYVIPDTQLSDDSDSALKSRSEDNHQARHREAAIRVRCEFEAFQFPTDIHMEWRLIEAVRRSISDVVLGLARTVDLVVVSQPTDLPRANEERSITEHVIVDCDRPCLVIPLAAEYHSVGRHIIVAWNGTRRATRAIFISLPVLINAETVTVCTIKTHDTERGQSRGVTAHFARTLSRHGITLSFLESVANDAGTGKQLLQSVDVKGADLLVMGAYGHSRLREIFLGGTTRSVMRNMRIPVLMTH